MVSWTGYCWICHWPCSYGAHYILCYDIIVLSSHFSSIFLFIQFATTVVVKFSVMSFGLFVTLALVLHDRGIELLQKFSLQTISILLLTRHVFCYTEFHLLLILFHWSNLKRLPQVDGMDVLSLCTM